MIEFTWKRYTFVVKRDSKNRLVYRDKAHLGGPWTEVDRTLNNKSYDRHFRSALQNAASTLT